MLMVVEIDFLLLLIFLDGFYVVLYEGGWVVIGLISENRFDEFFMMDG